MIKYCAFLIFVLTSISGFCQTDGEKFNLDSLHKELNYPDSMTIIEINAEFPGGEDSMFIFLKNSIKYPKEAERNDEKGRVVLRFIVNETGEISDITIINSVSKSIDEEAIRVVKSMPKWMPGYQRGIAVKQYYTLPLRFTLPSFNDAFGMKKYKYIN